MVKWIKTMATLLAVLVAVVTANPQLITLRDGKIGVNFAGYHAEAGLGGLLTGNGAHGGLSASAGTPHGQQAGAGLGGSVDGQGGPRGGLYAGASGGYGTGASAALGGKVDGSGAYGGEGAEAHAGGVSKKVVKLGANGVQQHIASVQGGPGGSNGAASSAAVNTRFTDEENEVPVQQYRPKPKHNKVQQSGDGGGSTGGAGAGGSNDFDYKNFLDFGFFSNLGAQYGGPHNPGGNQVIYEKRISAGVAPIEHKVHVNQRFSSSDGNAGASAGGSYGGSYGGGGQPGPSFFDAIFNIPISTLGAVNQFLNGHAPPKGGHYY